MAEIGFGLSSLIKAVQSRSLFAAILSCASFASLAIMIFLCVITGGITLR